MKSLYLAALVVVLSLAVVAGAGQFNKKRNIGDAMPTFEGLDAVTNGKPGKLSSGDLKDKDVVVLCVTCNHCPVSNAYEDRILEFAKKYAGKESKVAFVAVMASDPKEIEEDSFEKMVERSKTMGYPFPYAMSPGQKLGRELGAKITPEFFVYDKNRKLVYMGVMDDDMNKPKENYLNPAVDAVLKGEKPKIQETELAGRGCGIMYTKPK